MTRQQGFSTNGGSGAHRYSDPATWGGDGDQLPAVQAYNVLRGIQYNGAWLYGLQNMAGAGAAAGGELESRRSPSAAPPSTGEDGPEPTYRSGGQINVNSAAGQRDRGAADGVPGPAFARSAGSTRSISARRIAPTFAWTDADLLSSEQQTLPAVLSPGRLRQRHPGHLSRSRTRAGKPPPRRRCTAPIWKRATATAG